MKTDRELLELAAKAIGYKWDAFGIYGDGNWWSGSEYLEEWNPLTDDGDALRLAVKLNLSVDVGRRDIVVDWFDSDGDVFSLQECGEKSGGDPRVNTRRAIVRAAAAIGEGME